MHVLQKARHSKARQLLGQWSLMFDSNSDYPDLQLTSNLGDDSDIDSNDYEVYISKFRVCVHTSELNKQTNFFSAYYELFELCFRFKEF